MNQTIRAAAGSIETKKTEDDENAIEELYLMRQSHAIGQQGDIEFFTLKCIYINEYNPRRGDLSPYAKKTEAQPIRGFTYGIRHAVKIETNSQGLFFVFEIEFFYDEKTTMTYFGTKFPTDKIKRVTHAMAENPMMNDYVRQYGEHPKIKSLPQCFPQDLVFKIAVPFYNF